MNPGHGGCEAEEEPTAHILGWETARTLTRRLLTVPGFGVGTVVQPEPFQCSMRVASAVPLSSAPTAQASHGESTVTPSRSLKVVPGLSGWTPVHLSHPVTELRAGQEPVTCPAIRRGEVRAPN